MEKAIAHDANNILTVLIGYVDLLNDSVEENNIDSIKKIVVRIKDTTERLTGCFKEITQSKIDIDVNQELVKLTTEYKKKDNRTYVNTNFADGPKKLNMKRVHFDRIFGNLIKNAVEAPYSLTKHIEVATYHVNDVLKIEISNDGKMIPDEIVSKIFEKGISTKGSTGLGLYSVQRTLSELGGKVTCKSDKRKTCFTVSFRTERK